MEMSWKKIKLAGWFLLGMILAYGFTDALADVTSSGATTNTQTSTSGSQTAITGGYNSDTTTTYQSGSSSTTNATTNNSTSNAASRTPVNMASAPGMSVYGQDSCVIPLAAGVTVIGFSGSFGSYMVDKECERRKSTSVLAKLGMKVAAISLMCQDVDVWQAMMDAGTPCPIDGLIGEKAKARWEELGGYEQTKRTSYVKRNPSKETDDKVEQYRKYKESMNEDHSNHNHD
jgi:hypothetical protein